MNLWVLIVDPWFPQPAAGITYRKKGSRCRDKAGTLRYHLMTQHYQDQP